MEGQGFQLVLGLEAPQQLRGRLLVVQGVVDEPPVDFSQQNVFEPVTGAVPKAHRNLVYVDALALGHFDE